MPQYTLDHIWQQGARKEQQDNFGCNCYENYHALKREGFLAVLCDGMGGLVGGAEASHLAVDKFITTFSMLCGNFTGDEEDNNFIELMSNAAQEANEAVRQLGIRIGEESNCGTTLVATLLKNDSLYWVSVGDSHLYVYHDGKLEQLNQDHIYANQLQEQVALGYITQEEADANPMREALTSFIGIENLTEISCGGLKNFMKPGMDLLLCSDGIYKFLGEDKITLLREQNRFNWANSMRQAVVDLASQYQDNFTAIVISAQDGDFDVQLTPTVKI